MNKGQLVEALEGRLGGKKAAADALDAIIDTITRAVARGEKVGITGFGTFEKAARAARTGRNPRTGQAVQDQEDLRAALQGGHGVQGRRR